MNKFLISGILLILLVITAGIYYFQSINTTNDSPLQKAIEYEDARKNILSDCLRIEEPRDKQTALADFSELFSALKSDVVINKNGDFFVSPSNTRFLLQIYNTNKSPSSKDRQIQLFPTPGTQKSVCLGVIVEGVANSGRVAYKTEMGQMKIINIIKTPPPIPSVLLRHE